MWNKQKGNRISRLVSDLQTDPKLANSLSIETGFPTSIADLFLKKNHDKMLKKSSHKKKYRSLHRSVSDPPLSLSKFDVPTCSIDVLNKDSVMNSGLYVDEFVAPRNPRGVEFEYEMEGFGGNGKFFSGSKKSNSNSVWLLILKGIVVVVVALYTKSFVLGVSIGAFLFCMLEYLGKSIFGFFKPCENARRKLRGFPHNHGVFKTRRGVDSRRYGKKARDEGVLNGTIPIDVVENGVVSTRGIEAKVESIDSQKRGFEYELRNDLVSRWGVEPEDIDGFASKDELEQGNVASCSLHKGNSYKHEEEFQGRQNFEIENVEPNSSEFHCASPRPFELRGGKRVAEMGEEESEGFEMDDRNGKVKKGKKKFWKKFVPKHSKKKKHKHRKGQDQTNEGHGFPLDLIEDTSLGSEEENEQEDEEEMTIEDATSSSFSLPTLDEREREGVEHSIGVVVNHSNIEMLHTDECTNHSKSSRMMKKQSKNFKSLGMLGVVLAGLMGGRVFALVLTVICCLMLKMVRG